MDTPPALRRAPSSESPSISPLGPMTPSVPADTGKREEQRGLERLRPASLWLQTLLVLGLAVGMTAAVMGPLVNARQESQLRGDLEHRGQAMLATMVKDYELRLAISLKDSALAEPILGSLV